MHGKLDGWFLLAALGIAFFWGAAHALSPGHGKSIIAAYLVGSRGTARHAVLLGGTVTVTHTIGVFALGLVTLSLSQFILPDQLYPWLNLVSALLIVGVGLSVLRWRLGEWRHDRAHAHAHAHGHATSTATTRHDDHGHSHDPALGMRRLLGIGISGGIIPCPTALVVLLAAISLHRVGFGLVLILAFSLGLAATMTGLGLLAVAARGTFRRVNLERERRAAAPGGERRRRARSRPRDDPPRASARDMKTAFTRVEWLRLSGFGGAVLFLHVLGWGFFVYYSGSNPALAGLGVLAYTFGLRHAFDADHIAAIDNTTRKLLQEKKRPVGAGFFFSLGHSTIVFALATGLAVAAHSVDASIPSLQTYGSTVGAASPAASSG